MNERILVFNTGSTTIKYKLFEIADKENLKLIKQGSVEDIGSGTGPKNHKVAISILFQGFGFDLPYLAKIENLAAIGHRVVHGGNEFNKTTLITDKVIESLKKYNLIAPLHNPGILDVMQDILKNSGQKGHRDIPNYAVFDSSYFGELPNVTKIYPLPYEYYQDYGIRRFGFHGISHQYAVNHVLANDPEANRIISIHLGAGCSMAAIKNGTPIDTSMGFTPLEGLMMATRSGDIDAGIIHYLIERKIIHHSDVDTLLNYNSGLKGVSGVSGDMRELLSIAGCPVENERNVPHVFPSYLTEEKKMRSKLAIEMFIYRIKKYIGAYYAILGGCDALIFTGTIGVKSSFIRNSILEKMDHMLTSAKIEVIETDEELQIAKEIMEQIHNGRK